MKEPVFISKDNGAELAYSAAPTSLLLLVGCLEPNPDRDEFYSSEFRKDYAARILKARGL